MWDWLSSFGNFLGNVSPYVGMGFSLYNNANRPSPQMYYPQGGGGGGGGGYSQPQFDPSQFEGMMPDWGEMMQGFSDMFGQQMMAQNSAMEAQRQQMLQDQQRGFARQASTTRRELQARGVYGDPNSDTGAASSEAVASMMGVSPQELQSALRSFGSQYGWDLS